MTTILLTIGTIYFLTFWADLFNAFLCPKGEYKFFKTGSERVTQTIKPFKIFVGAVWTKFLKKKIAKEQEEQSVG